MMLRGVRSLAILGGGTDRLGGPSVRHRNHHRRLTLESTLVSLTLPDPLSDGWDSPHRPNLREARKSVPRHRGDRFYGIFWPPPTRLESTPETRPIPPCAPKA